MYNQDADKKCSGCGCDENKNFFDSEVEKHYGKR